MSGKQTIGLTLTAWLVVCALGFAACSRQEPPMPRNPDAAWLERQASTPPTIASTVCYPALSPDARYAALEACSRNGARLVFDQPGYVLCDRGQRSWFTSALDMPRDKQGHQ